MHIGADVIHQSVLEHPPGYLALVLAVMSGKGGVGKSSVTTLMARALVKKGLKVGIMDENIDELKEEITYLKKRIDILEKTERKRKAFKSLRIIIKILFYGLIIFGIWKAYDYLTNEVPNMVSEEVENAKDNIVDKAKEIWPFNN